MKVHPPQVRFNEKIEEIPSQKDSGFLRRVQSAMDLASLDRDASNIFSPRRSPLVQEITDDLTLPPSQAQKNDPTEESKSCTALFFACFSCGRPTDKQH